MRSFILLCFVTMVSAFVAPSATFVGRPSASTLLKDGESNIETIEFRIFPDGRVEEVVQGVKGMDCNKVTEEINAVLGKVVDSAPTEEMFQQELTINTEITISEGSDWEGSSTW